MKTGNSGLPKAGIASMKRNTASALLTAMAMLSATAVTDVLSAPLTINAVIEEHIGYAPGCDTHVGGTITGTGISNLLGRVSLEANDCITPIDDYFVFDGTISVTISNGSELFADYSGKFMPTRFPSIFVFEDSRFNITGGTGNFLGATGGGILQGGENILTGQGVMQARGSIFGFKKPKNTAEPRLSAQHIADSTNNSTQDSWGNAAAPGALDKKGLFDFPTIADYHEVRNDRLLAINALPEASSLSLLGLGLLTLAVIRRRKQ